MTTTNKTATVPYKFLVRGLFCAFVGLVAARIAVPLAIPAQSAGLADLVRDLWACAQSILAALLGLLAGKAAS
ncbi:MAG: hypothetical protein AB1778_06420 [Candidatus Bipolaricaulota bacterium]